MPIRSRYNQYRGINAHLHSALQHERGVWEIFHGVHITHLTEVIDAILPAGYAVDPEKSMQIRAFHPDSGETIIAPRQPRPDLTIYASTESVAISETAVATQPTRILPAIASLDLDEQSYLRNLVIKKIEDDGTLTPVTWIELLSPTNKPPNSGAYQYREKRNFTIRQGLSLVEIDYLHETRSPVPEIFDYRRQYPGATPYNIVITRPQPVLIDGSMWIYEVSVDEQLPAITVPLRYEETITLDLQQVYNRTFSSLGAFSRRVNYAKTPVNFDSYDTEDKRRIERRMTAIKAAIDAGDTLSETLIPLEKD
ncbi:MAG: DUF4058 family protein [Aggregatilineales bacterium]